MISELWRRMTASPFRRNTVVLVRANLLTQAILLAATPILTRLFSPGDFGAAGLFATAASFCVAVASWRFDWSIPSADNDQDADALLVLSLWCIAGFSLLLFLVILGPSRHVVLNMFGMQQTPYAPLLPLMVLASGAVVILASTYVRRRNMAPVSSSRIIQSTSQLLTSLASGVAHWGALGLILSYTVGPWMALIKLWPALRGLPWLAGARLVHTARRYLRQASISTGVSVMNFAFTSLLPVLLLLSYPVREVGLYYVALRLAGTPASLLSAGIASSFWGEAATLAKTNMSALRQLYLKVTWHLAVACVPVILTCLAAPFFLPWILGDGDWTEAGLIMAACTPQIVGTLVFSSTNHLIVYDRQGYQFAADFASVIGCCLAVLAAGALSWPFWMAVLLMSAIMLAAYILRFALHLKANEEMSVARAV
jgi:O-antigen/teichoic acid export membrane protein